MAETDKKIAGGERVTDSSDDNDEETGEPLLRSSSRSRSNTVLSEFDLAAKVMLVGDSSVGKTCLLIKFREGTFLSGSYISTIGIDFRNKVVDVDKTKVKLQIWDTAGQERFRSITRSYYRDTDAVILVYDITNRSSFDNVRSWLTEIQEYTRSDSIVMLLGNKADLHHNRVIQQKEAQQLAEESEIAFMETSAQSGYNVELAFTALARTIKDMKKAEKLSSLDSENSSMKLRKYVSKDSVSESKCSC